MRVPSAACRCGQEAELGEVLEAAGEDGVEGVGEAGEVVGMMARGVAVDVVLEVLAEEAGAVPGQTAGAGLEEEAELSMPPSAKM